MKKTMSLTAIALAAAFALPAAAQPAALPPSDAVTLIQNVRIFDGKGTQLSGPSHVLVRGNRIERISATPILAERRADTVVIDGGGRTLMPGLITCHFHPDFYKFTLVMGLAGEPLGKELPPGVLMAIATLIFFSFNAGTSIAILPDFRSAVRAAAVTSGPTSASTGASQPSPFTKAT